MTSGKRPGGKGFGAKQLGEEMVWGRNAPDSAIMGLVARKPVFGFSDKASFKPVSSATETS